MDPLLILLFGVVTVVGLIIFLRTGPFIALIGAALLVSFLSPIDVTGASFLSAKVDRVAVAFGTMAGQIGILLTMGAIIGKGMAESGAADRIIQKICYLFGRKRLGISLLGSGFLLSIPVFYDATFYLLLPLAKSVYRMTRNNYLLYLLAIGLGATISHTLIPPTPGPLVVAQTMNISFGTMIFFGLMIGTCMIPSALAIATFVNWYFPHPEIRAGVIDLSETHHENSFDDFIHGKTSQFEKGQIPSFFVSILPITIPVGLIAANSVISSLVTQGQLAWSESDWLFRTIKLLGTPNIALIIGAILATITLKRSLHLTLYQLEKRLESALENAGTIILITAAGGAFGAMLRASGVGERIGEMAGSQGSISGIGVLLLAFGVAAMIKTAQGSSTTAMITVSGIFATMNLQAQTLGFHPAYIAVTIGIGSCVTGWMNDSGFCIFSRMSGIRETDALKTWTVALVLLGLSGLVTVLILSRLLPFIK